MSKSMSKVSDPQSPQACHEWQTTTETRGASRLLQYLSCRSYFWVLASIMRMRMMAGRCGVRRGRRREEEEEAKSAVTGDGSSLCAKAMRGVAGVAFTPNRDSWVAVTAVKPCDPSVLLFFFQLCFLLRFFLLHSSSPTHSSQPFSPSYQPCLLSAPPSPVSCPPWLCALLPCPGPSSLLLCWPAPDQSPLSARSPTLHWPGTRVGYWNDPTA